MNETVIKIAPSLERADWLNLKKEIHELEGAGVDILHLDIMDRTYGDTILFSPKILPCIKAITDMPLDVHMYVEEPSVYFEEMFSCLESSDYINIELEAVHGIASLMQKIAYAGCIPAVSIDIQTPVCMLEELVPYVNMVNVILRNAGAPHQRLHEQTLCKMDAIKELFAKQGKHVELEVDGSIDFDDLDALAAHGADIFVLGSKIIFRKDFTYEQSCQEFRERLQIS